MSFISAAAHQKFIMQCRSIISATLDNSEMFLFDDKNDRLMKDLTELEQLMEAYMNMLSEVPKLTCKYYNLHRQIRVNMRKMQLKKRRKMRRKLKSR